MVNWLISTYYIAKQDLQTGQELNRWQKMVNKIFFPFLVNLHL